MLYERIFTKKTLIQISVLVLVSFALLIVAPALTVSAEGEGTTSTLSEETTAEAPTTESTPDPSTTGSESSPAGESSSDTTSLEPDITTSESTGEITGSEEGTTASSSTETSVTESEPPTDFGILGVVSEFSLMALEPLSLSEDAPSVSLDKTVDHYRSTGEGTFVYTFAVKNTGTGNVQITRLVDHLLPDQPEKVIYAYSAGDLPVVLAPDATYEFTSTEFYKGIGLYENEATVTVINALNVQATDQDKELVIITDTDGDTNWTPQAWDNKQSKYQNANIAGWKEGEWVFHRLIATNYDVLGQTGIAIQHDYQNLDKGMFGFDSVDYTSVFIGPVRIEDPVDSGNYRDATYDEAYAHRIFDQGPNTFSSEAGVLKTSSNGRLKYLEYWLQPTSNYFRLELAALETAGVHEWAIYWKAHLAVTGSNSLFNGEPMAKGSSYFTGSSLQSRLICENYATGEMTITYNSPLGLTITPAIDVTKTANPTSLPETGGTVEYTVSVTNTGNVDLVLDSLMDDRFGNLADPSNTKITTDIDTQLPYQLAIGATFTGTFTAAIKGNAGTAHTNTVTGTAHYFAITVSDMDDATVDFTNVLPTIEVTKTANPTAVPETGGDVIFTFVVKNTSSEEAVTITSISDSDFTFAPAEIAGVVGTELAAGASTSFSITRWVEGDYSGPDHSNTFTAHAQDNDGTDATDTDDATVDFTNVLPAIEVTKTANPTAVPETGGNVTFTFVVKNTSSEEAVTITSVSDNVFTFAPAEIAGVVGTILVAGASTSFSITRWVEGNYSGPDHVNVFTAHAEDNDGTDATDTDNATVDFTNVLPTIEVTKTANPTAVPETGGNVTFTFVVKNTSSEEAVTITSVTDSDFTFAPAEIAGVVGTVLAAGASTSFSITRWVEGDYSGPDHVNVFTAHAEDNDGTDATDTDDATVDFTNVLPTIEVTKTANPTAVLEGVGGLVTFTFSVKNTSSEEPVTITSLVDSVYGPLDGDDDCKVGTILAAGASASFEITRLVSGDYSGPDHVNVFTAKAVDNDGSEATDEDDATVDFTNALPTIEVTKTANPTAVPETGGNVTFTFVVKNTSASESVTITSLSDSVYGTLVGDADCMVGTVLAAGASAEFSITEWVEGDYSGPDHVNVFTAKAVDNEDAEATDTDDATVDFTNVLPTIEVTKTPSVSEVPETGGNVTFTFVVKNTSTEESVTISSLVDSVFGTLAGDADCMVGSVLAAGTSAEFSITEWVEGDYSGPDHVNVFTAKAVDNENTEATDTDDATVDFTNVLPTIEVTKTPSVSEVPETGGNVTFTFVVKNTSSEEPVTITSLSDSVYGTLAGDADCMVGTVLAAGASAEFSITEWVEGDYSGPDHVNVFTAHAEDNDDTDATDTDDATIDFTNVLPTIEVTKTPSVSEVPETGGNVTFTFVVKNTSSEEPVTITSLSDSVYGTLAGDADCKVGTVLAAGASAEFSITEWVEGDYSGPDHVNVFTAHAEDNDGTDATDTDDATVDFTNVLPTIEVTKTPSVSEVPETGGNVTFTFVVKNTSSEEPVTITSLSDSVYGTLAGDADCMVGTVLAAGASAEFSITEWVEGDYSGPDHVNVFTAHAEDNDDTDATDTDDATVDFTNVLPTIEVTKTADPTAVLEGVGGLVTFTFTVKNTSSEEPVTITSLTDSVYGPLDGDDDCKVGTILAAGASAEFSITRWINGDYSGPDHVNVFTAHAEDNDGTDATDSDDATVDFTNVPPTVDLVKTVTPATLAEPGGTFTFTLTITNTSSAESVIITSLTDTNLTVLPQALLDLIGTMIPAGGSVSASYTVAHATPGIYPNTATVIVVDNDETPATDSSTASVTVTNAIPSITVAKTAITTSVDDPGDVATFQVSITNTSGSTDPVTINSLTDVIEGGPAFSPALYTTAAGTTTITLPQTIQPGATLTVYFFAAINGDHGDNIDDTVTVTGTDDEGTPVSGSDPADVDIDDEPTPTTTGGPTVTTSPTLVVFGAEMPETGEADTYTYKVIAFFMLLLSGAFLVLWIKRRRGEQKK